MEIVRVRISTVLLTSNSNAKLIGRFVGIATRLRREISDFERKKNISISFVSMNLYGQRTPFFIVTVQRLLYGCVLATASIISDFFILQ